MHTEMTIEEIRSQFDAVIYTGEIPEETAVVL